MTWTEVYDTYLTSDSTVASISDLLSQSWLWEPPSPLPEIRDPLPRRIPVAPHIRRRYFKTFTGHKFRIGGNKA